MCDSFFKGYNIIMKCLLNEVKDIMNSIELFIMYL